MTYLAIAVFVYWLLKGSDLLWGVLFRIPVLEKSAPPPRESHKISVILAACNEAENIRGTVERLLAQDHPCYEIVAVNDRSTDDTLKILNSFRDARLKVLNVETLPEGWLGKTHALFEGYHASSGEWLLFTDADVRMDPATLSSAVAAATAEGLDHLTLLPHIVLRRYSETLFTTYFTLAFNMRYRPWAARSQRSLAYAGIGAFNFVQRGAYEEAGTHRALALDVADDMMLGRRVKRAGFQQMAMFGHRLVSVRWVRGFRGVLNALHKNAFRGLNYSLLNLLGATVALAVVDVVPFVIAVAGPTQARMWGGASVAMILLIYLAGQQRNGRSLSAFPLHPLSSLFFIFLLWRSALAALKDGGVFWRDTFYPLRELRRGVR